MKFYVLIILCLVQGLTEFLPISSSGHLMIAEKLFGITDNVLLINLFLHLATLFAVVVYYRKIIFELLKKPFQPLTAKLVISTIITVVIAGIYEVFKLGNVLDGFLGYYFLATSVILLVTYLFQKKSVVVKTGEVGYKSAIAVGFMQGIAVLPGISRSGSTIGTLLVCGNDDTKSAEYSFLLSIPVIIGGFVVELIKIDDWSLVLSQVNVLQILFAFVFTFVVALFSIMLTIKLLKKNKFIYFSIYTFVLAIIVLIFLR